MRSSRSTLGGAYRDENHCCRRRLCCGVATNFMVIGIALIVWACAPQAKLLLQPKPALPRRLWHGRRLGERRGRGERAYEGRGHFHWVDLCLGHYWDTRADSH